MSEETETPEAAKDPSAIVNPKLGLRKEWPIGTMMAMKGTLTPVFIVTGCDDAMDDDDLVYASTQFDLTYISNDGVPRGAAIEAGALVKV